MRDSPTRCALLPLQRKFIEAALRYYHLSQLAKREIGAAACAPASLRRVLTPRRPSGGRVVAEEELMMALNAAVRRAAAELATRV